MSDHLCVPLTKPQFNLCLCMTVVHFCKNTLLIRQTSEHTCASTIYYWVDSVTRALHCKVKFAIEACTLGITLAYHPW